jgi:plastocyanin
MMLHRSALVLAALCASVLLAPPVPAWGAGVNHEVRIEGMKFVPERIEVRRGDTVTWVNQDVVPHTVTAREAGLESGQIDHAKRWSYKAGKPGEIPYVCRFHPGMRGILVVK